MLWLIFGQGAPVILLPGGGVDGLQGFWVDERRVGQHLRGDVEGRNDQLLAHGHPAVLLGTTEQRQGFVDATEGGGHGDDAELAAHTLGQAELGELAREGFGMYDGNVLPTPILAIHGIAIAHPEIVEVHQYRRVIDDERQGHSIQGVSDDALPTGRSSIGNRDASSHGRDEPDLRQS